MPTSTRLGDIFSLSKKIIIWPFFAHTKNQHFREINFKWGGKEKKLYLYLFTEKNRGENAIAKKTGKGATLNARFAWKHFALLIMGNVGLDTFLGCLIKNDSLSNRYASAQIYAI